jgi:hypothetical protein
MHLKNFGHFQNGDVLETFRNSILLLSYLVVNIVELVDHHCLDCFFVISVVFR